MEPRGGTRRKIKPRCIVNYSTSRRSAIDAYVGSVWQEGDAVSKRGPLRGERG